MQRFGPPPSYPTLRIPGLNAPIPEGYVHQTLAWHNIKSDDAVHSGVSTQVGGGSRHSTSTIVLYMEMCLVFYRSLLTHLFVGFIFPVGTPLIVLQDTAPIDGALWGEPDPEEEGM